MKTVKDKFILVAADFAGFPLKEVIVKHLVSKGRQTRYDKYRYLKSRY